MSVLSIVKDEGGADIGIIVTESKSLFEGGQLRPWWHWECCACGVSSPRWWFESQGATLEDVEADLRRHFPNGCPAVWMGAA